MALDPKTYFTKEQHQQIDDAIKRAESETSGEIVPVLCGTSGNYDRGLFIAALTGALTGTLFLVGVHFLPFEFLQDDPWTVPLWLLLPVQALGLIAGYRLAASNEAIWRRFVPRGLMKEAVERAALNAFSSLGIDKTRDATGILIYASLFEHVVVVLGDKAIDSKLPKGTWDEVKDLVLKGFREGKPVDGYTAAIEKCGKLLAPHFPIKPDDTNELPNTLHII
jgi:putative membrane protein